MKKITFAIFIIHFSFLIGNAQWFFQNNVDSIKSITSSSFINSNTGWFVGVDGRITKTTDGGITWNTINFNNNTLFSVKFFNSNIGFVCGTSGKIFKSTNGGANWIQQNSFTSDTLRALDFLDENTGWCAGTHIILKTSNGGQQWVKQNIDTNIINPQLYSIKMYDNQNGLAGGKDWIKNQDYCFIFRTTNGGNNWILTDSIYHGFNVFSFCYTSQNTVYLSAYDMILKSTNGGISWNINSYFYCSNCPSYIQFKDINTGWAICGQNMFKTTNNGSNWFVTTPTVTFLYGHLSTLSFISEGTIISSSSYGELIKSTDGGLTWGNYSMEICSDISGINIINANTVFISGTNGMLCETTDGGNTWKQKFRNNLQELVAPVFINQNIGYCYSHDQYLYKTTDAGENWLQSGGMLPGLVFNLHCVDDHTLWTTGNHGMVLRSTNSGVNWVNKSPDTNSALFYFWVRESSGTTFLRNDNKLFKSINSGNNWIDLQLDSLYVFDRIFFLNDLTGWIFSCIPPNSPPNRFYKTTNGGNNWTKQYFNIDPNYVLTGICFLNEYTGFSATGGPNILKTTDGGYNWFVNQTLDISKMTYKVSFINENTGWIIGWFGLICKTTNGGTSFIMKNGSVIPEKFSLSQNYPNPFNPVTKIRFDLPLRRGVGGMTSLKIYNITGREIQTLVNEQLQPGTYEVTFNASNLASGVYFYQLRSGDFVETKKLVLLK